VKNNSNGKRGSVLSGRSAVAVLTFSLLALSGCGAQRTRPTTTDTGAGGYVDGQMAQTIDSVDRSLKVLVSLERGDAGSRKDGFIGDTVAGAKTPNASGPAMPNKAQPQTDLAQREEQARLSYNRQALQARVKAQWDGSASELLRTIAQRIDYRYQEVGAATLPDVHLTLKDASAETVLSETANQIKPAGSIRVLTGPRVVCLVRSTSADANCAAAFSR
jgi:hypothetical protein